MPRRAASAPATDASLIETLVGDGLDRHLAEKLDGIPRRAVTADPRRTFREIGAPSDELIFIVSGLIAKFKQDSAGRRQIIALRYPGEAILPREGEADYGVQAIIRSDLLVARASDLNRVLEENPEIAVFLFRQMQRHSAIGHEWLVNTGRRDSMARVAHLLCETAYRTAHGPTDRLVNPFTQQQIADITGQTSVNVNRVFADLERQGLIQRQGREIIFRDWTELKRIAGFNPGYLS
jgi:CRP-like cAMP-binding protein